VADRFGACGNLPDLYLLSQPEIKIKTPPEYFTGGVYVSN
jgi:hypothetical protein